MSWGPMRYLVLPFLLLLLGASTQSQSDHRDSQFCAAGLSPILTRSAFAHGYSHGYEEGYHVGNIDINMGRSPRTSPSQFRDVAIHYSPAFGPQKSFHAGFIEGLKAGYTDGFSGRMYRAASLLRFASDGLSAEAAITDPKNLYFDQGVSAGYGDGLDRGQKDGSAKDNVELAMVGCSNFQPVRMQDLPAQGSFCEGYRRGYLLGHSDGFALRPEHVALQASK